MSNDVHLYRTSLKISSGVVEMRRITCNNSKDTVDFGHGVTNNNKFDMSHTKKLIYISCGRKPVPWKKTFQEHSFSTMRQALVKKARACCRSMLPKLLEEGGKAVYKQIQLTAGGG